MKKIESGGRTHYKGGLWGERPGVEKEKGNKKKGEVGKVR